MISPLKNIVFWLVLALVVLSIAFMCYIENPKPVNEFVCISYKVSLPENKLLLGNEEEIGCTRQTTEELFDMKTDKARRAAYKFCEETTGTSTFSLDKQNGVLVCDRWDQFNVSRPFRVIWNDTEPIIVAEDGIVNQGGKTQRRNITP